MCHRRGWNPEIVLCVILAISKVAAHAADPEAKDSARRLQVMKDFVAAYALFDSKDRKTKLTLIAQPQLRWTNPVSGISDGSFFVWTNGDRPEVAMQLMLTRDKLWLHEFSSLSSLTPIAELDAKPCWTPLKPGIEFKLVPDASPPAETPFARLKQMKDSASAFVVEDNFEGKGWTALRLLSTPLLRYGKPDGEVTDGAMFAFVHGTDPEALLLIEARKSERGKQWYLAFAPMTSYELKASRNDVQIWSVPWRKNTSKTPEEPFFLLRRGKDGE